MTYELRHPTAAWDGNIQYVPRGEEPQDAPMPPLEGGTVLETASQPDATPAPLVGTDRVGIRLGHARS